MIGDKGIFIKNQPVRFIQYSKNPVKDSYAQQSKRQATIRTCIQEMQKKN
ncbi:hypothetical protein ADIARSV_3934 [Arcticibacter svalbardensis MN12-7]|uniref:Uncharacterized protein n=1 Tax=Arcticibacter svalbardensis MN12-7 TaxID=1150600 RepID=R9GMC0_9SPHI|nr:hypothetical protein ADIARSV_3934 [Arcticibacter svalbardensis MN12-7]